MNKTFSIPLLPFLALSMVAAHAATPPPPPPPPPQHSVPPQASVSRTGAKPRAQIPEQLDFTKIFRERREAMRLDTPPPQSPSAFSSPEVSPPPTPPESPTPSHPSMRVPETNIKERARQLELLLGRSTLHSDTTTSSDDSTRKTNIHCIKLNSPKNQENPFEFPGHTKSRAQLIIESTTEASPQADAEPTSDANPQVDAEPTSEASPQVDAEPTSDANPQVDAEPTSEANPQVDAEPTSEANPQVDAEPTSEAGPQVNTESINTPAASEPLAPPEASPTQQNRLHRNAISENHHIVQPAAASYIANLAAANSLFTIRLHDRTQETRYNDALTGQQQVTSLWLRQVGSHNNWRDSTGQVKTQSNSYVAQLGGDIVQWSTNGHNRGHLGLMAGYGNHRGNSHSSVTGSSAKATVRGYSVGLYGTWFANDTDKSGLYIDSWLQYNWFNNYVNAEKASARSYQSKGVNLSLETGYTLTTKKAAGKLVTGNAWYFQPQAQAVLMGVKADSHRQTNGDRAISRGTGNIQTRLGLRVFKKEPHVMAKGKEYAFAPFIEANWLHNTRDFSSTIGGTRTTQSGARNIGEVKVGVTGKINQKLNLWGNIGAQIGDKGYNSTSAMIGIKYSF